MMIQKGKTDKVVYNLIHVPTHPNANRKGYVFEHRLIAEKVLGRFLTAKERIHHVDYTRPNNIVICPDTAYHNLIEARQRALEACGHVDWKKCPFCKYYDAKENMTTNKQYYYHKVCRNNYLIRKRAADKI